MEPLLLFLSTKTTRCQGVPTWSDKHRLIQLNCFSPSTGQHLTQLANPNLSSLPEKQHHPFLLADLVDSPSCEEAAQYFHRWVDSQKQHPSQEVCCVVHGADLSRDVFLRTLKEDPGWHWFDTLEAFRQQHKAIGKRYWPHEQPYSLATIKKYFQVEDTANEVKILHTLFLTQLSVSPPVLESPHLVKTKQLSRTRLLRSLRGIGPIRTQRLCGVANRTFEMAGLKHRVNPSTFMVCHLLMVGVARCQMRVTGKLPKTLPNVIREVETVFRAVGIFCDEVLVGCLAACMGMTPVDFILKTELFPALPFEPLSYKPFTFIKEECKKIQKLFPDARTATELHTEFLFAPCRDSFVNQINSCLREPLETDYIIMKMGKI